MQETPKAAAAYAAYEQMGPDRSLAKLAEQLYPTKTSPNLGQLKTWSSQFNWQARVAAYDASQRERERTLREQAEADRILAKAEREKQREIAREKMDDDRAEIFAKQWPVTLKAINEKIKAGDTRGLVGLVTLAKLALDEERLARGSPTQMTALTNRDGGALSIHVVMPTPETPPDDV